ncbi:MAG: NDP-sugar synthase [Dehalococcoidia bacterium]|nr:NDP-sugar synthase [Dehalococcoidia bacterium]
MKAVILSGGLGTRLRPLTWNTPKSLVPVLNKPFLEHVLRHLKEHGIDEVVLALSNLASSIQEYFGCTNSLDMKIDYVMERSALGTAGAIKNAAEKLSHDSFFVLNGDIFSDLDYSAMLKCHRENNSDVTIALTAVDNPAAYGLVETKGDGRVTRFLEKPRQDEITTNLINAGTYIFEPGVLDMIPTDTEYSTERQLFPSMLASDASVRAFASSGYWIDIGSPEKYRRLNFDLLSGRSGKYGFQNGNEVVTGQAGQVHPTAKLEGPVLLGDNCVVESNAVIMGPAVIGDHCHIGEAATISASVIWPRVTIGNGCKLISSIAADNCVLQSGCEITQAILGNRVKILKNYKLPTGSMVEPKQIIG